MRQLKPPYVQHFQVQTTKSEDHIEHLCQGNPENRKGVIESIVRYKKCCNDDKGKLKKHFLENQTFFRSLEPRYQNI